MFFEIVTTECDNSVIICVTALCTFSCVTNLLPKWAETNHKKSILTVIWPSRSSYSPCLCSHLLSVCWEPVSVSDLTVNSCRSHNEANDRGIMDFQWPQSGQLKLYAQYNYAFYWWGRKDLVMTCGSFISLYSPFIRQRDEGTDSSSSSGRICTHLLLHSCVLDTQDRMHR